jgi:hypothetical protein
MISSFVLSTAKLAEFPLHLGERDILEALVTKRGLAYLMESGTARIVQNLTLLLLMNLIAAILRCYRPSYRLLKQFLAPVLCRYFYLIMRIIQ